MAKKCPYGRKKKGYKGRKPGCKKNPNRRKRKGC